MYQREKGFDYFLDWWRREVGIDGEIGYNFAVESYNKHRVSKALEPEEFPPYQPPRPSEAVMRWLEVQEDLSKSLLFRKPLTCCLMRDRCQGRRPGMGAAALWNCKICNSPN